MLKHTIILITLSILVILLTSYTSYAQDGMIWLLAAHDWVANALTNIFSGGQAGNLIREMLALLCIPVAIGLIPAILYWAIKRHWFPYFMEVVWVVWLIQVGALLVIAKTAPIVS
ncbi:MAG: hypothetical protein A3F11_00995 [Gammaproteobacteria bacterium RIFCSPHIGHO2_12_FULL_37_14]|nr:MAG: hypothetical protein A3F11_00995 [Gammaproteobacteria bacterium RIFCSPHIGHO2_12_FULL_37_14]